MYSTVIGNLCLREKQELIICIFLLSELGIINQLAATLKSLACEQEVAVVVVNNVVQADYGKKRRNDVYDGWKPALGR